MRRARPYADARPSRQPAKNCTSAGVNFTPDWESITQCAAVKTCVGEINAPEQNRRCVRVFTSKRPTPDHAFT